MDEQPKRGRGRPRKVRPEAPKPEMNGSVERMAALLPRAERTCGVCDWSRLVGRELRCWKGPPTPTMLKILPPRAEGLLGVPVIVGTQVPTWEWYSCSDWALRQGDHPDIGVTETVPLSEIEAQLASGTRQ